MPTEKMIMDQQIIRADFPILMKEIHDKPLVYLDNAATTLKPACVADRIAQHYLLEASNIHRGVHSLSEEATKDYEGAREKVRAFINAEETAEVIFTSGTTESINLVVNSYGQFFREGDEIIISEMEHHSNIVPWQMICEQTGAVLKVIPMNDQGELVYEEFEKLLTEKTKFFSIVYVSNALGTINPIKKMIDAAHQLDVPVLVDVAQAIAHTPIDVKDLDCEFMAFSGHKMFGPTGVGVLYGKKESLERLPPWKGGGDMILSVTFEKTIYNQLPARLEAGTPNIGGVIGLGEAIDYINKVGWQTIEKIEDELLVYGTEKLSAIDGLRIIGTAEKKAGVISFYMDDVHPHDIGTLVDQDGIAIRTGHHCAQPVMKYFSIPATARASFSIYNTKEDFDRLAETLNKIKEMFS
ncbi:MAG: cysteine desulfurase [Lentisphaerales bacterium]|nr:cysteine desulfurase [Lentisphaerales bacterium]